MKTKHLKLPLVVKLERRPTSTWSATTIQTIVSTRKWVHVIVEWRTLHSSTSGTCERGSKNRQETENRTRKKQLQRSARGLSSVFEKSNSLFIYLCSLHFFLYIYHWNIIQTQKKFIRKFCCSESSLLECALPFVEELEFPPLIRVGTLRRRSKRSKALLF